MGPSYQDIGREGWVQDDDLHLTAQEIPKQFPARSDLLHDLVEATIEPRKAYEVVL
jgi:hypothetical protein